MEERRPNALFRQQAVAQATNNLLGKVLVIPRMSALWLSAFLLFWVVAAVYWMCTAHYDRHVTVKGWIEPDVGATRHFATLNQGVISEILVTPGQRVEAGQPLVRLKAEKHNAKGDSINGLLKHELTLKLDLLTDEEARLQQDFERNQYFLNEQYSKTSQEQAKLTEVIHGIHKQSSLAAAYLIKIEKLHVKGWASDIDLHEAKHRLLKLETDISHLEREQIQLANHANQIRQELVSLPSIHEQSKLRVLQQKTSVNQELIRLESSVSEIIVAQVSGRVSNVHMQTGKINKSKPLLTIIPSEIKFIALLPVPTHAAGFVQTGQHLAMRYDAYPHEKHGIHSGTIHSVNKTVSLPEDFAETAAPVLQPVYMVRAVIAEDSISAYGTAIPLKSGMTFSADISLGKRTIIEWLFAPLISLKGRL